MDHLYAPWRFSYVSGKKIEGCVFCHASKSIDEDEDLGVLFRDEHCFVIMNKFPYTPGHFMVIPHAHIDNIEELDDEVWLKISLRVKQGVKLLKDVLNAHGVNIGMNLGEAAGAGIAPHIHYHLLPRYKGDTNFITTIANTRVYPTDFHELYNKLKEKSKEYFL